MAQEVNEDTLNINTIIKPFSDLGADCGQTGSRFSNIWGGDLHGSMITTRTVVNTATYTILSTDTIIGVTYTTTGIVTITLPLASTLLTGKTFYIVDEGGNSEQNNITVNVSGTDTINGDTSLLINLNYTSIGIYVISTGSWFIF